MINPWQRRSPPLRNLAFRFSVHLPPVITSSCVSDEFVHARDEVGEFGRRIDDALCPDVGGEAVVERTELAAHLHGAIFSSFHARLCATHQQGAQLLTISLHFRYNVVKVEQRHVSHILLLCQIKNHGIRQLHQLLLRRVIRIDVRDQLVIKSRGSLSFRFNGQLPGQATHRTHVRQPLALEIQQLQNLRRLYANRALPHLVSHALHQRAQQIKFLRPHMQSLRPSLANIMCNAVCCSDNWSNVRVAQKAPWVVAAVTVMWSAILRR